MTRQRLHLALAALVLMGTTAVAQATELFSLEVGAQDHLIIKDVKNNVVADLAPGAIQQPVKVDATSFIVSYGQDTSKRYSAILAPDPNQPKSIEFVVAGNRVYADNKASVTVTFSSNKKSVSVDPGAFGMVSLNGNRLSSTVAANTSDPQPSAPATTQKPAPSQTSQPSAPASSSPTLASNTSQPASGNGSGNGAAGSPGSGSMAGSTASRLLTSAITMTPSNVRFWAEPITPPSGRLPSVSPNQMKLVEVRGPVTLKLPNGRTQRATNGMLVPNGATVRTTSGSSAAVFIGGVNSARLTENSTAKFNHNATQGTQATTVDLTRGCVFSKVGRKSGQRQDYKVRTPVGIAAAKGTDYATLYRSNEMYVFVVAGRVFLFDLAGNLLGSANTTQAGQISFISTDDMTDVQRSALINEIVTLAGENNSKINNILSKMARGVPLTQEEQAYLAAAPTIGREQILNNGEWNDFAYNPYWGIYTSLVQFPGTFNPTDSFDPLYDILNQPTLDPASIYDQPFFPSLTTPF
ncbi:MAG: FecR family protein [Verrucomicrobiota bacterium]